MGVYTIDLAVTIRKVRIDDLGKLEWFGMLTAFRDSTD